MKQINDEQKTTFIFSTHDQKVMEQARRISLLKDGVVVDDNAQNGDGQASGAAGEKLSGTDEVEE